jgi:hypothetical protein
VLVAGACALGVEGSARADEPSAADKASARRLAFDGIALAEKGDCVGAVDKLARAEKLFHAPTTLGRLGECQILLGKVVEGTENLGRTAREELAPGAPPAFVHARARAKRMLANAPRPAHAKIIVKAPPEANVSVTIDGAPIPAANVGEDRSIDPGTHVIEAAAAGYKSASASVTLIEGGNEEVRLTLTPDPDAKPDPNAAAEKNRARDANPIEPPAPVETAPNRTLAYVMLGVGTLGVGVGAVFGIQALTKKSQLEKACPANRCQPSEQEDLDAAKSAGTVSTIGIAAGAGALALGGILLLVARPGNAAKGTSAASIQLRGTVTPTSLGLSGTF